MKMKKLNLLDFKQNELSREEISSVKAGETINPKPTQTVPGSGSGGGTCYYDFEGNLLYCEIKGVIQGEPVIIDPTNP